MLARKENCPTAATAKLITFVSDMDLNPCRTTISMKKMGKDGRRFSEEQIRSLEFMFESESRPEPQMKHQLANKLGLQPRQVAIWFQNRRARLKTKQIEREYNILKANYDALTSTFESLKKENQSLVSQLQTLRNLLGKTRGSTNLRFEQTINSSDGECKIEDTNSESKEKPGLLLERYNHNIDMPSDDANSQNLDCFQEETDILNNVEHVDGLSTSSGTWSSYFLGQSSYGSQLWEL
ncbi:hypothetical protein L1049_022124 [Liquidambar formosana]|uniref:Homeobox-leucine zipper protein n=1 Tax=Liquidambar formosana TaxID=63359 RepID=A0AAP0WQQ3_LIQFO